MAVLTCADRRSSGRVMRVVLAFRSSLTRARAERTLQRTPTCQVVGTARDGAHANELRQILQPDFILCDMDLYPDLASHLAGTPGWASSNCRLVLLVAHNQSLATGLPPGVSALLPIDLPAAELSAYLHTMVDRQAQ